MRHFLLIAVFCLSKAFAQLGPPDLRCLQVLPNGDVVLTWIAPPDPTNIFNRYEIYTSPLAAGPYATLASITVASATTYTHVGANANTQGIYYFMRTFSGTMGNGKSDSSETLRSIFMNAFPEPLCCLKLTYNNLHQPKLPSSNGSFSIHKEYPIGSWSVFGATSALNYYDTLSVCQASINYQVTLLDNSGCTSTSNMLGGVYKDLKPPDGPKIDSVSVLPNGDVIIAWQIPRDMDIIRYRIYDVTTTTASTAYVKIDSVSGRPNRTYTLTGSGSASGTVGITVAALDSCNRIGVFDTDPPVTMFLKTDYNRCAYKTLLSWNAYRNMPGGLKEYRIYCSVNGGIFSLVGTTSQTSFVHENVPPGKNLCYFVRAFNKSLTVTSSSNRPCLFSREVDAPAFLYLRTASITGTNTARLKLYIDTTKALNGITIYRSANGLDFEEAGFMPPTNKPHYTFTDSKIEPGSTSYYYKGVVKDSCGNARTVSNISKTILLKVRSDKEQIFIKHLGWSAYEGFSGGVSGYNIYRIINDVRSPQPVNSTGALASTYTDNLEDEAPNGSKVEYMVEAIEGLGNAYGFIETSQSNTPPVYMEGNIFIPSAFAPNGINKVWRPVTHFIDKAEYRVMVFNRWGNKLFDTTDDTEGWTGDDAEGGVYAYKISYKNARGEYQEVTGTLLLYR